MYQQAVLAASFLAVALAQMPGKGTKEIHPPLPIQECSASGCNTKDTTVVLDANWRWLHNKSSKNCFTGTTWDQTMCADPKTCATECYLDGAQYTSTYGISAAEDALTMKFVTTGQNKNVGSRVYLMASETEYQMFHLLNQEFTFDVDVSKLPCGLNGALYFVEMDADGGMSKYSTNKAGAAYGTGYCDAQCPQDIKFIDGQANSLGWSEAGGGCKGQYGSCCNEMDIWEANSMAAAYTPHVCSVKGQTRCEGNDCGASGFCDKAGCDFNSYRMGNDSFFGPNKMVDSTKPFTVVTQFLTDDNTSTGTLTEIHRQYVQNGKVIANSKVDMPGVDPVDCISDKFCAQQKKATGDTNTYGRLGGTAAMGGALSRGMVLTLSVWDDYSASMLWLDSDYPVGGSKSKPGVSRGVCSTSSGKPADVEASSPNAAVVYSNIKFGPIGSTCKGVGKPAGSGGSGSGSGGSGGASSAASTTLAGSTGAASSAASHSASSTASESGPDTFITSSPTADAISSPSTSTFYSLSSPSTSNTYALSSPSTSATYALSSPPTNSFSTVPDFITTSYTTTTSTTNSPATTRMNCIEE